MIDSRYQLLKIVSDNLLSEKNYWKKSSGKKYFMIICQKEEGVKYEPINNRQEEKIRWSDCHKILFLVSLFLTLNILYFDNTVIKIPLKTYFCEIINIKWKLDKT